MKKYLSTITLSLLVLFAVYQFTGSLVFLALLGFLVGVSIMAVLTSLMVNARLGE